MMKILPDTSVLIPYLTRRRYSTRIDHALQRGAVALCSVVAAEVCAGARDRAERQHYDRFFTRCRNQGISVTPDDIAWLTCGRLLSRYRERYGAIDIRDHQNDILIMLSARQLARNEEIVLLTENDSDFRTWLTLAGHKGSLRIEAVRPNPSER